ncbi:hypothetical protein A3J90_00435 [candidate division WOR-1 bacterium RIFOXYC2_FULL_37_10]|uniref:Uncharacterized protein n=1 Tax=candidate division WOR-1 bacterium RIFOXYB2_FULL_37_13 TaxID=1802579 RepID=A0A1F4SMS2_UNCSA|nr:MAG: hypothetical protein A2310_00320 [candidate division WOR-1 bacterium RIFOXYB2_FULL_37_13]OGC32597.1 MAG: hypothetical protein A3J90_00435 [candidate division WOR-1 bacterium RIFOXYC2_FULL_37_10]
MTFQGHFALETVFTSGTSCIRQDWELTDKLEYYIIENKFLIPLMGLSLIQLGAVIPVKVDPKNPKRVAINAWNINPSGEKTAL